MIRIYDDFAQKLLTFLAKLRVTAPEAESPQVRYVAAEVRLAGIESWARKGLTEGAISEINNVAQMTSSRTTLDEVIIELGEQMYQRRHFGTKGEQTLVDAIIKALRLDTAAPVLGGRTLQMLREALLKPSELAAVERRLRSHAIACSNCQRDIVGGEAATVTIDDNGNGQVYCYSCCWPSKVKCASRECEEVVYLEGARFGTDLYCPTHSQKVEKTEKIKLKKTQRPVVPPGGQRRLVGQWINYAPPPVNELLTQEQLNRPLQRATFEAALDIETGPEPRDL